MASEHGCPHAEQAVGWTLHALEPADEEQLTEHIPSCPACQELARQTQDVIWGLAAATEQVEPPTALRESLISGVTATAQLPAEQRERPWQVPTTRRPARSAAPAAGRVRSSPVSQWSPPRAQHPRARSGFGWFASRPTSRRRRLMAVIAAVAITAIGVGGVVQLVARSQGHETAFAAPSPKVARLLADADRAGARHAVLRDPAGLVTAAVAVFPGGRQVMPIGLPANPTERSTYVLWGLGAGPPTALGAFDISAPSETMLPVGRPVEPTVWYPGYGISLENGRGVPAKPGHVVASGQVAS